MSEFRIGMKVVCVDDNVHSDWHLKQYIYCGDLDGLAKGAVYTVSRIYRSVASAQPLHLVVAEIDRKPPPEPHAPNWDRGYAAARFRPLEEKPFESSWVKKLSADLRSGKKMEVVG